MTAWSRVAAAVVLAGLGGCAAQGGASSAGGACASDPAHWARASGGCLAMEAYGPSQAELLVVVLHGDLSGGGPAGYHRAFARRVAEALPGAAAVAMVRPGYSDPEGRTSDGSTNGRSDHYTASNVDLVFGAIGDMRGRVGARRVIAIGHSGGAATAADILALHPGLIDAAVLLACPCDTAAWRVGRRPWTQSMNPMAVADQVPRSARVVAYTGSADDNTGPALARGYVERLGARGVDAHFFEVPGATHNSVVDAVWSTGFPAVLAEFAAAR